MNLWNDVRFGARMLRKSPGFTITAVVTMALGCGATTAIFSVCDAMLWKPVPLPQLDRLVMVVQRESSDPNGYANTTPADTADIRREVTSLTGLASWQSGKANIVGAGGEPERVEQYLVSANFFDVIGVPPARGRGFLPGEDQPGREREVVLSDALWRNRFAAQPDLVGRTIRLDDRDFLVVGIAPPKFVFPKAAEVWTPMALEPDEAGSRRMETLLSAGRLKPGRGIEQLSAELEPIARRLEEQYPNTNRNRRFLVLDARRFLTGDMIRQYMLMLFASVLFVLLIACVNVANLQFARATTRLREVAVRTALGAARGRIVAQLLTESLLLSLAGAALGLLLAAWGVDLIRAGMPPQVGKFVIGWKEINLDARAMVFTLTAALLSGILAGLAPAWQSSRPDLSPSLREGGRGSSASRARHRVRNFLVGAEVALAVVLLVGASLMVRGFQSMVQAGASLEPRTLLTMRLALTEAKYPKFRRVAFYSDLLDRLRAIPGVKSAVAATALPASDHSTGRAFQIEGRPLDPTKVPSGMYQNVTAGYFETLHIPLRAGRFLDSRDGEQSPRVAVISQRMAQRFWPGEPWPLGRRIRVGVPEDQEKGEWMTIVGVAGDVLHDMFDRNPHAVLYVPHAQNPSLSMDVAVRTSSNPLLAASAVTAAVRAVDPEQPVTNLLPMDTLMHNQAVGLIYVAVLMGVFGVLALALSCIGVYSVMAYLVQEQTHEIGIRMALGAPRDNVLGMVLRRGMIATCGGLAIGLGLACGLARLLQHLIQGVSATDAATFVGIPLVLLASAALAILIPARRAMRIDPIVALRYE